MIVFNRTAEIARGKMAEALPWAHKIAGIWEEITGVSVTVMTPVGGKPFQIVWTANYDGLGAYEEATGKAVSNEAYVAEITSAADLFIEGSVQDGIWQTS